MFVSAKDSIAHGRCHIFEIDLGRESDGFFKDDLLERTQVFLRA